MDHRAESVLPEQSPDKLLITHIADYEFDAGINNRRLVTENEVVQNNDFPALAGEEADGVGTDVSSAPGDKNRQLFRYHGILQGIQAEDACRCQPAGNHGGRNP
jgi:hypothetical protein